MSKFSFVQVLTYCGELCDDGAYVLGNEDFEGEWFNYEDMDEVVLDTILSEAVFD